MNTENPRRLFESDDVPFALRSLLVRAHEDVLPNDVLQGLVVAAERRAGMPGRPPSYHRCVSWAKRNARRSTRFLVAAAVMGAGAGAYYGLGGNRTSDGLQETKTSITLVQPPAEVPAAQAQPTPLPSVPEPESQTPTATSPSLSERAHGAGAVRGRRGLRNPPAPSPEIVPTGPAQGEEFRLLRAARQALLPHPDQALQLTDEHARRFANGMLAQEREAIAIEALVALGQPAQARQRSRVFFQSYPSSPYRSRVERALDRAAAHP